MRIRRFSPRRTIAWLLSNDIIRILFLLSLPPSATIAVYDTYNHTLVQSAIFASVGYPVTSRRVTKQKYVYTNVFILLEIIDWYSFFLV